MKLLHSPFRTPGHRAKAGFTMIEMMIVVGILALIVALAIPNFLKARNNARIQLCIETLSQIESAKQLWGVEHGKRDGDLPGQGDLIGSDLYLKRMPTCPGAGTYDFKPIGTAVTCTLPGHSL